MGDDSKKRRAQQKFLRELRTIRANEKLGALKGIFIGKTPQKFLHVLKSRTVPYVDVNEFTRETGSHDPKKLDIANTFIQQYNRPPTPPKSIGGSSPRVSSPPKTSGHAYGSGRVPNYNGPAYGGGGRGGTSLKPSSPPKTSGLPYRPAYGGAGQGGTSLKPSLPPKTSGHAYGGGRRGPSLKSSSPKSSGHAYGGGRGETSLKPSSPSKSSGIQHILQQSKRLDQFRKESIQHLKVKVDEVDAGSRPYSSQLHRKPSYSPLVPVNLHELFTAWNIPSYTLSTIPFTPPKMKDELGRTQNAQSDRFYVLYHGTTDDSLETRQGHGILAEGTSVSTAHVTAYGKGFYVTPDFQLAASYARTRKSGRNLPGKPIVIQYIIARSVAEQMLGELASTANYDLKVRNGIVFTFAPSQYIIVLKNMDNYDFHRIIYL